MIKHEDNKPKNKAKHRAQLKSLAGLLRFSGWERIQANESTS